MKATREQILRFRLQAQGLEDVSRHADSPLLDLGVQDTGPDGGRWALELRGCSAPVDDLVLAWTLRGAPHFYRRREAAQVAAAVAPFSETDAHKRTLDAFKPLKAAGITMLDGMSEVATQMRAAVTAPTVKGELSSMLTTRLPAAYLRECRPCNATHIYEQTFRLSALQAGLELEPGTSPPVLRRIPGWRGPAAPVPPHLDVIRATLRLLGPADPPLVAGFLEAAVKDVRSRWPDDVVEVEVDGATRSVLAEDEEALAAPPAFAGYRLLGPFDLYLQARDRELILPDPAARKDLWRTLGRPGAILAGSEIVGSWRPRASGRNLRIAATMYDGGDVPDALAEQGEHLAAFRGVTFAGFV